MRNLYYVVQMTIATRMWSSIIVLLLLYYSTTLDVCFISTTTISSSSHSQHCQSFISLSMWHLTCSKPFPNFNVGTSKFLSLLKTRESILLGLKSMRIHLLDYYSIISMSLCKIYFASSESLQSINSGSIIRLDSYLCYSISLLGHFYATEIVVVPILIFVYSKPSIFTLCQ